MDLARFKKLPILGILRSPVDLPMEVLVETIVSSGLETIEIAMNSRSAASLIVRSVKSAAGRLTIGAGSVLDIDTLRLAIDSGATFIVMPTLVDEVIEYCRGRSIPVFPGAFSPTEIYNAWRAGAAMVKVFPSSVLGPSYIREVKAPFGNIDVLACGGVKADNIRSYFASGASAVAFGASIFREDWIRNREFVKIGSAIRDLISNAK